jgi:hypothetical protein
MLEVLHHITRLGTSWRPWHSRCDSGCKLGQQSVSRAKHNLAHTRWKYIQGRRCTQMLSCIATGTWKCASGDANELQVQGFRLCDQGHQCGVGGLGALSLSYLPPPSPLPLTPLPAHRAPNFSLPLCTLATPPFSLSPLFSLPPLHTPHPLLSPSLSLPPLPPSLSLSPLQWSSSPPPVLPNYLHVSLSLFQGRGCIS